MTRVYAAYPPYMGMFNKYNSKILIKYLCNMNGSFLAAKEFV